jgi:enamine deaminase RidA (YjgF/YER057c/UK114 family)
MASPSAGRCPFAEVAQALRQCQGRILQERIFAQTDELARLAELRSKAYGGLDDGVSPTWLTSPQGRSGNLAGVQVHAVAGIEPPIAINGHVRVLRHAGAPLVTVSALASPGSESVPDQVKAVFDSVGTMLTQTGTSMGRIARTWLWIDPIYQWYRDLNLARNRCFVQQGMISPDGSPVHLPASTGIGLRPSKGNISLEAIAPLNGHQPVTLAAGGKQNCALGYGSAFSRAATLHTPSGDTHYVSGTAAIDATGKTIYLNDGPGQILNTIDNVRAVLRDLKAQEADIVQGVAYCITPEIAEAWNRLNPGWPLTVVLADICRDDLLFEIEITACPGAKAIRAESAR